MVLLGKIYLQKFSSNVKCDLMWHIFCTELENHYLQEHVLLKQNLYFWNSPIPSWFSQMFIGDGAKLVRDAFALAKEKAPAIIFIDELDAWN